jgi:hypothetical protein
MIARSMASRTGQHVMDLLEFSTAKKPERAKLRRRIKEVIYGQRPAVKLYSQRLHSDLWLVNEGLVDPAAEMFQGKAITMQVLAELMLVDGEPSPILYRTRGGDALVDAGLCPALLPSDAIKMK